MAEQRILRNTSANLVRRFEVDGTATDADGTVNVAVTDEAGDTVVASTPATSEGSGVYSYLLTPQSQLNRLTVTWSGTWSGVAQSRTDNVEVVGAHLFTESEARNMHATLLASATVYPDSAIAAARDRIADRFQHVCAVSFVPRYERDRLAGNGSYMLQTGWPRVRSIIAATIGGTAQTVGDIDYDPVLPYMYHTAGTWTAADRTDPRNVVVEYEHGWETPPAAIKRAALIVLRHEIVPDEAGGSISARAISLTDEIGTMRLSQPDMRFGRPYGIPEVDATLREYSMQPLVS